jgi:3-phenylpropionate/trans-cinnamate dioxygenase ferredoxin reductase subunit
LPLRLGDCLLLPGMSSERRGQESTDLTRGVPVAELEGGAIVGGHVGGEPVLVARVGDEDLAIGAKCTHYGGPLAEGLRVGDTVRCPWHHACFSLRTGEALRAPALSAVPCWATERRGDRLFVLRKRASAPTTSAPRPTRAPESVVIVGAGAAGGAAAEMLRRRGYEGPVTLVGADPAAPYDRPNASKDYLAGTASEDWMPLWPPAFYGERRIALRLGRSAVRVDPARREVELSDGSILRYGALLLATGATPRTLAIPGADRPIVHTLRTLADSRAILAASRGARRAVVVGASFIGLEVAAALRTRGLEVDVVAREQRPFERLLGPELGDAIRALHEAHGVRFHLADEPKAIEPRAVALASGGMLAAELVVLGVGVTPDVALARSAGLALDRGVVVDEHLETSVPGIFAAGDLARWPDGRSGERIRVEHWVVAERQGQTAARNLLGERAPFDAVPFFWSQHYDVPILYVGHAEGWERLDVAGDVGAHDGAVALRKGATTLAVATIGRDRACLEAELAMERGDERALAALVPPGGRRRAA